MPGKSSPGSVGHARQAATNRAARKRMVNEAKALDMYLRGDAVKDIADDLGVRPRTVYDYIDRSLDAYKKLANRNTDKMVADELARLARVEREAWKAWEKSKTDKDETHVRKRDIERPLAGGRIQRYSSTDQNKRVEKQNGDARFLQIVLEVHKRRSEMLGLREHMATPQVEDFMRRIGDAMREMNRLNSGDDAFEDEDKPPVVGYGGQVH